MPLRRTCRVSRANGPGRTLRRLALVAGCASFTACSSPAPVLPPEGFRIPTQGRIVDVSRSTQDDAVGAVETQFWAPVDTTVAEVNVGTLLGPLVLFDVTEIAELEPNYKLNVDDLERWQLQHGELPPASIVVLRTGNSDQAPHPTMSAGLIDQLLRTTTVRGFGIDAPALASPSVVAQAREGGAYIVTGLQDLGLVPPRGGLAIVAPVADATAERAPARVMAVVPRHVGRGGR